MKRHTLHSAWRLAFAALLLLAGLAGTLAWLNLRGEAPLPASEPVAAPSSQQVERGAYLARAGNCAACHTERGGAPFAGGKGIATPFGTVYASNLTPDAATGLGHWSSAEFWRAMHHGRSRDGRLLYPAFPYTEYTRISREDADALHAYLRSLPPVTQANRPHDLRFPYNTRLALAVWRALFFRPGEFRPEPARSAEWNRGAYLVQGLGHCQACHAPRNALGATAGTLDLSGGSLPLRHWVAPALSSPAEAGVQDWSREAVVQLLREGKSPRGTALGPMAEVVYGSTQHLSERDLRAMALFLQQLPTQSPPAAVPRRAADAQTLELGARLYRQQCAECHGESGEGSGSAYPALQGHRTVTLASSANLLRVIISGGFPATTAGQPRPYGMPPFGPSLDDAEIAAVASYVRSAWGNAAPAVLPLDVQKVR